MRDGLTVLFLDLAGAESALLDEHEQLAIATRISLFFRPKFRHQ